MDGLLGIFLNPRQKMTKMSEEVYISARTQRLPLGGSLSNEGAPALIDRATLDFRDMREVGGLIVRRECSHTKGSARLRLAPSATAARFETYRVLLNIRDIGAGGLS